MSNVENNAFSLLTLGSSPLLSCKYFLSIARSHLLLPTVGFRFVHCCLSFCLLALLFFINCKCLKRFALYFDIYGSCVPCVPYVYLSLFNFLRSHLCDGNGETESVCVCAWVPARLCISAYKTGNVSICIFKLNVIFIQNLLQIQKAASHITKNLVAFGDRTYRSIATHMYAWSRRCHKNTAFRHSQ